MEKGNENPHPSYPILLSTYNLNMRYYSLIVLLLWTVTGNDLIISNQCLSISHVVPNSGIPLTPLVTWNISISFSSSITTTATIQRGVYLLDSNNDAILPSSLNVYPASMSATFSVPDVQYVSLMIADGIICSANNPLDCLESSSPAIYPVSQLIGVSCGLSLNPQNIHRLCWIEDSSSTSTVQQNQTDSPSVEVYYLVFPPDSTSKPKLQVGLTFDHSVEEFERDVSTVPVYAQGNLDTMYYLRDSYTIKIEKQDPVVTIPITSALNDLVYEMKESEISLMDINGEEIQANGFNCSKCSTRNFLCPQCPQVFHVLDRNMQNPYRVISLNRTQATIDNGLKVTVGDQKFNMNQVASSSGLVNGDGLQISYSGLEDSTLVNNINGGALACPVSGDMHSCVSVPSNVVGRDCGQVGVTLEAFNNQPHACDNAYGNCLENTIGMLRSKSTLPFASLDRLVDDGTSNRISIDDQEGIIHLEYIPNSYTVVMKIDMENVTFKEPEVDFGGKGCAYSLASFSSNGMQGGHVSIKLQNSGTLDGYFYANITCNGPFQILQPSAVFQTRQLIYKQREILGTFDLMVAESSMSGQFTCNVQVEVEDPLPLWSDHNKLSSCSMVVDVVHGKLSDQCVDGYIAEPRIGVRQYSNGYLKSVTQLEVQSEYDDDDHQLHMEVFIRNDGTGKGRVDVELVCESTENDTIAIKDPQKSIHELSPKQEDSVSFTMQATNAMDGFHNCTLFVTAYSSKSSSFCFNNVADSIVDNWILYIEDHQFMEIAEINSTNFVDQILNELGNTTGIMDPMFQWAEGQKPLWWSILMAVVLTIIFFVACIIACILSCWLIYITKRRHTTSKLKLKAIMEHVPPFNKKHETYDVVDEMSELANTYNTVDGESTYRVLEDFCFQNLESGEMHAMEEYKGWRRVRVRGLLCPPEGCEKNEDNHTTPVSFEPLQLHWSRTHRQVWVASCHMWYILRNPSSSYRPLFMLFIRSMLRSNLDQITYPPFGEEPWLQDKFYVEEEDN